MAWLSIIGVGLQAVGGIKERQAAQYNAAIARQRGEQTQEVLDEEAGQTEAAAQRTALAQDKVASLVESRAKAVAAASGAGATDPTVINLVSRISAEGALRSLTSIYEGEERARKLRISGDLAAQYGVQQGEGYDLLAKTGNIKGFAGAASGAASLYAKYGGGDKIPKTTGYSGSNPSSAGAGDLNEGLS